MQPTPKTAPIPVYLQDRGSDAPVAFAWWYRIAAPKAVAPDASYGARERLRRGRLASIILLLELIVLVAVLITIGLPSQNISLLITVVLAILAMGVGILANRQGLSTLTSWIVVASLDVAMLFYATSAPGGMSSFSLPMLDLLVEPVVVAAFLFPISSLLLLAGGNILAIVLILTLYPHSPELAARIAAGGQVDMYFRPIALQVVSGVGLVLLKDRSRRDLQKAQRAEEIVRLQRALAERDHRAAEEKLILDAAIQQIEEIHRKVANGELNARVSLAETAVLSSLGGKLNILLTRYQKAAQAETNLNWTLRELSRYIHALRLSKQTGQPLFLERGGTPVDQLIIETRDHRLSQDEPGSRPLSSLPDHSERTRIPS